MYSSKHAKYGPYALRPLNTGILNITIPMYDVVRELRHAFLSGLGMVSTYPGDPEGRIYMLETDRRVWKMQDMKYPDSDEVVIRDATGDEIEVMMAFLVLQSAFKDK